MMNFCNRRALHLHAEHVIYTLGCTRDLGPSPLSTTAYESLARTKSGANHRSSPSPVITAQHGTRRRNDG